MRRVVRLSGVAFLCAWLVLLNPANAEQAVFAKVEGETVLMTELGSLVNTTLRQRFYHGRLDGERIDDVRHEVAGQLVDQVLLRREALRRGIEIDDETVELRAEAALSRFQVEGLTAAQRKHLVDMLRKQEREKLLLEELRSVVAGEAKPDEEDVAVYYRDNLDRFTTPQQLHLSVILLKVAPSSAVSVWQAAKDEAERLRQRLGKGSEFAELARLHSGDASAEVGGDLGFVHQGMLSPEAERAVVALEVGGVSEPVALLQGVALFKLKGVKEAVVNPLEQVGDRAKGLLLRQMVEQKWRDLLESLRKKATIEIYDGDIVMTKMWANETVLDGR